MNHETISVSDLLIHPKLLFMAPQQSCLAAMFNLKKKYEYKPRNIGQITNVKVD